MPPQSEKSQLKRGLPSAEDAELDTKKPRRSERIKSGTETTPLKKPSQLPSPLTRKESTVTNSTEEWKEGTVTPPEGRPSQIRHRTPISSPSVAGLASPPTDTQAFSQLPQPAQEASYAIENESEEGVWGYLIPLDSNVGDTIVLKKRGACPLPASKGADFGTGSPRRNKAVGKKKRYQREEEEYENTKAAGIVANGYLIGRHPECGKRPGLPFDFPTELMPSILDRILDFPTISNRHCLLFHENSHGDTVALLEDLSSNGTFVNEAIVGRNKRRHLKDGDEITFLDEARFTFRYPSHRNTSSFRQQYTVLQQLGKGHFATVYLCVEKASGHRYAVKVFSKRVGRDEQVKNEGLHQEIAVLMGVSHPNMLCLKDTFEEADGVYLVLELAAEGELFNWIIDHSKLSEADARKLFIQLFQGIKYLHERNIVHRDIKPENILLVDHDLTVKLADFGLAKIIGEESFTTTLCGTPSYVAPEILQNSNHRKYTRAVDVWSLGVVLYICLCGFPPFSDELYSRDNPYTLQQQILGGRFDYPSPYWDSVGDVALDLIDRMLTVNVEDRITIDECLEHPWITQQGAGPNDSTDGLTGAMGQLDFSKRKLHRERTLLSEINDVKVARVIDIGKDKTPVKVFEKNAGAARGHGAVNGASQEKKSPAKEMTPAGRRDPQEFLELGGKGDQTLFSEGESNYVPASVVEAKSQ
ncbi:MAG: hypothetical protein M1817_001841 [Caeruleum heppii]|nr:MAG: hypothetical protein M1817_001841 [Caeruleum heppii]